MKATAMKDGGVLERVGEQMTRAQALRLKDLADEAYQPETEQLESGRCASFDEAKQDAEKALIKWLSAAGHA
jgi:hypothetical protein